MADKVNSCSASYSYESGWNLVDPEYLYQKWTYQVWMNISLVVLIVYCLGIVGWSEKGKVFYGWFGLHVFEVAIKNLNGTSMFHTKLHCNSLSMDTPKCGTN